jgi:hypothetical protein
MVSRSLHGSTARCVTELLTLMPTARGGRGQADSRRGRLNPVPSDRDQETILKGEPNGHSAVGTSTLPK